MSSGQDTKDAKEPLFKQIFQLNVEIGPITKPSKKLSFKLHVYNFVCSHYKYTLED